MIDYQGQAGAAPEVGELPAQEDFEHRPRLGQPLLRFEAEQGQELVGHRGVARAENAAEDGGGGDRRHDVRQEEDHAEEGAAAQVLKQHAGQRQGDGELQRDAAEGVVDGDRQGVEELHVARFQHAAPAHDRRGDRQGQQRRGHQQSGQPAPGSGPARPPPQPHSQCHQDDGASKDENAVRLAQRLAVVAQPPERPLPHPPGEKAHVEGVGQRKQAEQGDDRDRGGREQVTDKLLSRLPAPQTPAKGQERGPVAGNQWPVFAFHWSLAISH